MTREEFINELDLRNYEYKIEEDGKILVMEDTIDEDVYLDITSIPSGVIFINGGHVILHYLKNLPSGVIFKNAGWVYLDDLIGLPPDIKFEYLNGAYLKSILGTWINSWKGNIKGINSNTLLNKMKESGLFNKYIK